MPQEDQCKGQKESEKAGKGRGHNRRPQSGEDHFVAGILEEGPVKAPFQPGDQAFVGLCGRGGADDQDKGGGIIVDEVHDLFSFIGDHDGAAAQKGFSGFHRGHDRAKLHAVEFDMDVQLLCHAQDDLIVKTHDLIAFSAVAHGRQGVAACDLHGPLAAGPVLLGHGLDRFVRTGPLFPDLFNILPGDLVVSLLPERALLAVFFEGNAVGRISQGLRKDRDGAVHVDQERSHRVVHEIGFHLAGLDGRQHVGRGAEKEDLLDTRDLASDQLLKGGAGDHADGLSVQFFEFCVLGLRSLNGYGEGI